MNKDIEVLLGSRKPSEQAERVKSLLTMATAPVIDLIIRYDPRGDMIGITVIGGDLPAGDIFKILNAAEEMIRRKELEQAKELSIPKADQGG